MADQFESRPGDDWYALVSVPRPGSASLGKAVTLAVSIVIVLIALNLYAPGSPTVLERAFASAILASLALPVWLWTSGADPTIPFMPFLTVIFAYNFALPVFLLRKFATGLFKPPIPEYYITLALGYSLVGLYCMFAGYYGPAKWLFRPILPRFNLQWRDLRAVKPVALILALGGLFVSSSNVINLLPESLAQVGLFAADLSMVGICTLVALHLTGRLDWITAAFLWGFLIPIRMAIGLGTGSAASGLIVGILVAMMFASVRRSIPWKMMALGTVALFILRPAEAPYRIATWGGRLSDASVIEKARVFGNIVYRITLGGAVPPQALIDMAGMRLAQFTVFGEVIADTPSMVPFWRGRVFLSDPVQADPAVRHAGQTRRTERRLVRASIRIDHPGKYNDVDQSSADSRVVRQLRTHRSDRRDVYLRPDLSPAARDVHSPWNGTGRADRRRLCFVQVD